LLVLPQGIGKKCLNTKTKMKISVLIIVMHCALDFYAQQGVMTTGQQLSGIGGQASVSLGQTDFIFASAMDYSMSQGVQQPYEISVVTSVTSNSISLGAIVFPNPTNDAFTIKIPEANNGTLTFQIFAADGRLIEAAMLVQWQTIVSSVEWAQGSYYVRISDENGRQNIMKIIKF